MNLNLFGQDRGLYTWVTVRHITVEWGPEVKRWQLPRSAMSPVAGTSHPAVIACFLLKSETVSWNGSYKISRILFRDSNLDKYMPFVCVFVFKKFFLLSYFQLCICILLLPFVVNKAYHKYRGRCRYSSNILWHRGFCRCQLKRLRRADCGPSRWLSGLRVGLRVCVEEKAEQWYTKECRWERGGVWRNEE